MYGQIARGQPYDANKPQKLELLKRLVPYNR